MHSTSSSPLEEVKEESLLNTDLLCFEHQMLPSFRVSLAWALTRSRSEPLEHCSGTPALPEPVPTYLELLPILGVPTSWHSQQPV